MTHPSQTRHAAHRAALLFQLVFYNKKKCFISALVPVIASAKILKKKKKQQQQKKKKTPVSMTVFNPYIWLYEMPSYVLEHDMYSISLLMPPPPEQHRPAGDDVDEDGGTRGGGRGRYF